MLNNISIKSQQSLKKSDSGRFYLGTPNGHLE